jgi:parallel beta-helix repeat protein
MAFDVFERIAFHQLWQVTAAILVLGPLIRLAFRNRPHFAYIVWFVVLLKCVTPPIWSSPTGAFSWAVAERAKHEAIRAKPVAIAANNRVEDGNSVKESPADAPEAMQEADEPMPTPSSFAIGAGEIAALAWLCGVMALGGLLIGRWSYYFILLRHVSVETDDEVRKLVARVAKQLGLRRRVEVLTTTRPFGPAVYGLWRPTLILPQVLLKADSPDHLRRIVAHELIHVRRWDNLVGALQLMVQIVWWFHPLVWWMNRRICREREYCCDEEVVAGLKCEPGTYAQSLLDILKLKRQLRPALLPGVDAIEITTKRLEKIMRAKKEFHRRMPRAGWALLIAGILIILPGAGFSLPAGVTAKESEPKEEAAAKAQVDDINDLKTMIEKAKSKTRLTLPSGVAREPILIDKSLDLQGKDRDTCVLEITANEPAIRVTSKNAVVIDSMTIKWQLETDEKTQAPTTAISVKNGNLTLRNCRIIALGNPKRCPAALECTGFSNVKVENCTFEGFEFCINYLGGAEGSVTDCRVLNPGHCGITVFSSSKIEVARNIIAGSGFHGLRCTAGTLTARDNLIVNNKNRGIYLGNKPGRGTIENNAIIDNGTGISAFGRTEFTIANNLILKSSYNGLDARNSSSITVKNNIFQENAKGIVLFAEGGNNLVKLQKNTFWGNQNNSENIDLPPDSHLIDPKLSNADRGDFTVQAEELKAANQGLSDPAKFVGLWEQWQSISGGK